MFRYRSSKDRGAAEHGWLSSRHTFSFADYYDPQQMGFRSLRVINEDRVAPGRGFDTHAHHDMEIISYVLSGSLEHEDSMGNRTVILPDEVQVMSAGRGVEHSEYNHSSIEPVHFMQIWVLPDKRGIAPAYAQRSFAKEFLKDKLVLVASRDARDGSNRIHQDADIHIGRLSQDDGINVDIRSGRHGWIQMLNGALVVNGINLRAGDGLAVSEESSVTIKATEKAEFIFFDLI